MARTFNRRPLSVNTPSSSDLKEHFFNHYNWKGMNANKNFLAADQETFEECNNVYMNAEGLLRSRPGIKQTDKDGIIKFWNFNDITVHLVKDNDTYTLKFYKNEEYKDTLTELISESVQLIAKDDKIFIFTDTAGKFSYYDLNRSVIVSDDAEKYIYIPETNTVSGIKDEKNESENLMHSGSITSYVYKSGVGIPRELNGKNVILNRYGIDYDIPNFDVKTSPLVIFEREFLLPNDTNYLIKGFINTTPVYIACKINGNILYSIYSKIGDSGWQLRYERETLIAYNKYTLGKNNIGVSEDGQIFYVLCSHGYGKDELRFLSIIADENGVYDYEDLSRVPGIALNNYASVRVISKDHWMMLSYGDPYVSLHYMKSSAGIVDSYTGVLNTGENLDIVPSVVYFNTSSSLPQGTIVSNSSTLYSFVFDDEFNFLLSPYGSVPDSFLDASILHNTIFVKNINSPISNAWEIFDVSGSAAELIATIKYDFASDPTGVRFSDSGDMIFLPRGIYDLNAKKYVQYLNVLDRQVATVHQTGDESYYGFDTSQYVYSNTIDTAVLLEVLSEGRINSDFINLITKASYSELENLYVSNGSTLYISELRKNDDGEFLWYFPKKNTVNFPSKITALQPISGTEMAVFLEDEIWYISYQEGLYSSYKSKLKSGLRDGSDVITSYDGTNVIFPTERGLVTLSYQNFVASTDQTLTYLSDAISEQFKEFVKYPVKLLRYQFWILAYSPELTTAYLLDLRNNSWWPMTYHSLPTEFYVVDNEVLLLSKNKLFKLDKLDENYYDYDGVKHQINWNFKSQKLHLNAVNYYKHISNITLYSVLDTDREMNFVMDVNNYRKQIDTTEIQTISYKVDTIRTFVKRVSYPKVNEFQYNMHQDDEREIRLPLSLSGITIKYKVSGQVR